MRQLYLSPTGMGGVAFTGVMPADVAKLTRWQIENDFLRPMREMYERMKGPRAADHATATDGLDPREVYVGFLQSERRRVGSPPMSETEANAKYDRYAAQWQAAQREGE